MVAHIIPTKLSGVGMLVLDAISETMNRNFITIRFCLCLPVTQGMIFRIDHLPVFLLVHAIYPLGKCMPVPHTFGRKGRDPKTCSDILDRRILASTNWKFLNCLEHAFVSLARFYDSKALAKESSATCWTCSPL